MTLSRKGQKTQIREKKDSRKFFLYLAIITILMMGLAYLFYTMSR